MSTEKAVAVFTARDLQKVVNPQLTKEQLKIIAQPTPKAHIKMRPAKGGGQWAYVSGAYTVKMLNLVFGFNWDYEISYEFDLTLKEVVVTGKLTVRVGDMTVTKQDIGNKEIAFKTEEVKNPDGSTKMNKWGKPERRQTNEPLSIGNDIKAAATDGMKRCARQLGFFSDVYHPEDYKEIQVVDEDEKEQAELEKKLKPLEYHLSNCKNIDDLGRVENAYYANLVGDPLQEAVNLIEFYRQKL